MMDEPSPLNNEILMWASLLRDLAHATNTKICTVCFHDKETRLFLGEIEVMKDSQKVMVRIYKDKNGQ